MPKTLLPKSFLQFETPRSLVLAPNPLPQSPQKFNSINAPYIEVTTHTYTYILFHSLSPFLRVPVAPELKKYICMWVPGLAESDAVTFFAVPPSFMAPRGQNNSKGYHRLLVRFSAKCPNCVIFGMVVANDIENIFAKFQPPELI